MKRLYLFLIILILLCFMFTACSISPQGALPTEDFLRETVPKTAEIYLPDHLPLILTERSFAEELGDVPQTFVLDETQWEEIHSDSWGTDYYPKGDPSGGKTVTVYDDGQLSLTTEDYSALYIDGALESVSFPYADKDLYINDELWSVGINAGDYAYNMEYSYADELIRAYVGSMDEGFSFRYENGEIHDIFAFYPVNDDYSEVLEVYYHDDGTLDRISYTYYGSANLLSSGGYLYANYDSDYRLTETNLPGGAEAYAEEEPAAPAPSQKPSAEEPPPASEPAEPALWDSFIHNDPVFWDQLKELF